ncbi:MAG: hypothetical protein LBO67_04775 [Spirochaetaceae bacterium]|jgi:hypothetical protein|nr:hypothetical protein [Spirochaetaceae bacterium]
MFIRYNPKEKHLKCIPLIVDPKSENPLPFTSDALILRLGINEISEAEWEAIKPHIKAELQSGEITAFAVPVTSEKGTVKAKTLKDVPASVAKKIIAGCENPTVLERWFREYLPDEIMLMVAKRLRELKIDPDEFGSEIAGKEDTLNADIISEFSTEPESENALEISEEEDTSKDRWRGKKGAKAKKKQIPLDPEPKSDEVEDEFEGSI